MNENTQRIIALSNGKRTSAEIAAIVELSPRYVRKVMKNHDVPRLGEGARVGDRNHQYVAGRRIGTDGYVLVSAPSNHPTARKRPNRNLWVMPEHRLVMEQSLGRVLSPGEVVDHIDGLTLHNAPDNLRLFASNSDHLRATLAGRAPKLSLEGSLNTGIRTDLGRDCQPVDNYELRRARGEIRLRQMILAALSLGIDSPFLLGSHRHFATAQIDPSHRPNLELALQRLYQQWG